MKLRWQFGIIAGIFLAIFTLYPQMKMLYLRGDDWQGHYAYNDIDEVAYASYVRALIDGRPRKNDPYSGRDDSPETPQPESLFSIQFAAPYTIAIPARIFGIGAPWAMTLAGAFAGFLAALAVFWVIGKLTGDSWFAMAAMIFAFTWTLPTAIAFAVLALFVAPRIFPKSAAVTKPAPLPHGELFLRMAVGGLLTFCVATYAASLGERLSGIAALAPVLTPVLAVFIHRRSGADHAIALLRGLSRGLITLAVFVAMVAWCLPQWGTAISFSVAVAVALLLHGFALWHTKNKQQIIPEDAFK